jgi:hypothetical protein
MSMTVYMDELTYHFPAFPRQRLIREACATWNLRHPDDPIHPSKSEWRMVYEAVIAKLRHEFSDYDKTVNSKNHDQLREEIRAAAKRRYPWLRPDMDPRNGLACTAPNQLTFDHLSAELARLYSARQDIEVRLRQLRKQVPRPQDNIDELSKELRRIHAMIADRNESCQILKRQAEVKDRDDWIENDQQVVIRAHKTRGYLFADQKLPIWAVGHHCTTNALCADQQS